MMRSAAAELFNLRQKERDVFEDLSDFKRFKCKPGVLQQGDKRIDAVTGVTLLCYDHRFATMKTLMSSQLES